RHRRSGGEVRAEVRPGPAARRQHEEEGVAHPGTGGRPRRRAAAPEETPCGSTGRDTVRQHRKRYRAAAPEEIPCGSTRKDEVRHRMSSVEAGRLASLLAEFAELEKQLADPALHADPARARTVGRRYAQLTPIHRVAGELESARADLAAARELAAEDSTFAAEVESLSARIPELERRLAELLAPRDPDDPKDVILEIKAGEGGEESALFARDLLRMYQRYAERRGWDTEIIDVQESDLGGVRDVALAVKTRRPPEDGNGVWSRLKWEGGVHRVQRVPVTESAGRIHTSAVGVLVMPEAEELEVTIDPNDLRVDVFRSSGPGGQS